MRLRLSGAVVLLMMLILCVMLAKAFPAADEYAEVFGKRPRRGFKAGAADRISHGFGKRGQAIADYLLASDIDTPEYVATDEALAEALTRNRQMALQFVRAYVDLNDDGVITDDELLI